MKKIDRKNFSLEQICESGQCFRMVCEEGIYSLVAFGEYLEMRQDDSFIYLDCSDEEYEIIWKNYFDMDTDYAEMIASIDKEDEYLLSAAANGDGIRILKQDLWEMIISFIISQQNNIKRIRKCINLICEKYGEEKYSKYGKKYYAFPTPEALACASIEDLYACNLGYRSRYIHETSVAVLNKEINLDELVNLDYTMAREELLKLCGIGVKVADCICLFALHHTQAFPIDTHIKKVMEKEYPEGFPFGRYKGYSGILQQYIFYYDLQ